MSSEIAIRVENLSKCYQIYERPQDRLLQMLARGRKQFFREFWALHDVSFEIRKGDTVGIIGRNGSGKSTLLQIICGTLNPSAGNVTVNGRVAALLELGSGFNPEFSGRENVYMNAAILGLSQKDIEARYDSIVDFADIGPYIDQPVKTYSSGMVVRLAFAVIAHVDADILVIDEALSVGDAFFTQKCMRFLRNFMKTGTVLFVSHDTAAIKNLCNRCIWLNKGQIRADGTAKEVTELYLQDYYTLQEKSFPATTGSEQPARPVTPAPLSTPHVPRDFRQDFLNASNLRNDLKIFAFDPNAPAFGTGAATVQSVAFVDKNGAPVHVITGGELVSLQIVVKANQPMTSPIVGFIVKDRLGQALFGENTWLTRIDQPLSPEKDQVIHAVFTFMMPRLVAGDFTITVAVAEGTQESHVQHQWIFDALTFRSVSTSVSSGLVGIPFMNIHMDIHSPQWQDNAK